MEADEQQAPLRAGERVERWAQQVVGHILIQRALVIAHLVFVEAAAALGERPIEKLLRLAPERALQDHAEAPLQLVLLARNERAVVGRAEHAAERLDVAEQRAGRLDVLHEAPQLGQRVLHRRRGEQEDRRGPQEAAVTAHLGYEKHDPAGRGSGNSRNGSTPKTLLTDVGGIDLEVPRDRAGSFEPKIVRKGQTRLDGFNDRIIALYARGLTTRDIQAHLREMYQVEVSPDLISRVTDAVLDELQAWQARPLDAVYPVVFIDALIGEDPRRGGRATARCTWPSASTATARNRCWACGSARPPGSPRSSGCRCCRN